MIFLKNLFEKFNVKVIITYEKVSSIFLQIFETLKIALLVYILFL